MRKRSPATVAADDMIRLPASSKRRRVTGAVNAEISPLRVKPQVRPLLTRERGQVTNPNFRKRRGGAKWLETDGDASDALPLFTMRGNSSVQPPIVVTMLPEGSPVPFELDTGAVVT